MSVQRTKIADRPASNGRRAAFYDLDGTLVDLNLVHLSGFVLANLAEWSGRGSYLLSFIARLPQLYLAERQDRRLLNVALFEAFRGLSRDRLEVLGDEYCERLLMKHLSWQALEVLEANRAVGLIPVLVTGSPDFIVGPFARRLGVTSFAANRLVYKGGRATGALREPIMAGAEKATWCARFAAENQVDLASSWAYADSYYDLPLLSAVGRPVAVNPDGRLRSVALSHRWPIMHFEKSRKPGPSKSGNGLGPLPPAGAKDGSS